MIWNIPLLILAGMIAAFSIGWMSIEFVRMKRLQKAFKASGAPQHRHAPSMIFWRRLHRLLPPYMLFIIAVDLLYRAAWNPRTYASVAERQWIYQLVANKEQESIEALVICAALWCFATLLAYRRNHKPK